jgi:nicotinate-nucleotide adenylyltransferase
MVPQKMMRIGLYGGTFDPPHRAHLKLAEWVYQCLDLEYIYFIPAAIHAFKSKKHISSAELRFELVQAAIQPYPYFRISRIELDRPGTSYTIDTLHDFVSFENLKQSELFYIIGSDNLTDFRRWKNPDQILNLATLVVLRRAGGTDKKRPEHKNIVYLDSPVIDISATEIRKKVKKGQDISALVPAAVNSLIQRFHLYQSP